MAIIETKNGKRIIPAQHFEVCLADNLTKKQIGSYYLKEHVTKNKSCYYIQKFIYHIKVKHNLTLIEYCKKYLKIEWPLCPTKKVEVGYKICGNGIILSDFARGGVTKENCPNFAAGCKKLSKERLGEGNPMYGKNPWNLGLDSTDPRIKALSEKRLGTITPPEVRKKQSESAKKRKIHGHTGIKHSEETREKLRIHTANLWATGVFSKVTSIHIKVREFLESLDLKENFEEEYQIKYFSVDFAFVKHKIAIEADGDFYHINPLFYPDGPKTAIQRRNLGRDKAKNKYLDKVGWKILRYWECDINSGVFKERLLCKLKELNLLKN